MLLRDMRGGTYDKKALSCLRDVIPTFLLSVGCWEERGDILSPDLVMPIPAEFVFSPCMDAYINTRRTGLNPLHECLLDRRESDYSGDMDVPGFVMGKCVPEGIQSICTPVLAAYAIYSP